MASPEVPPDWQTELWNGKVVGVRAYIDVRNRLTVVGARDFGNRAMEAFIVRYYTSGPNDKKLDKSFGKDGVVRIRCLPESETEYNSQLISFPYSVYVMPVTGRIVVAGTCNSLATDSGGTFSSKSAFLAMFDESGNPFEGIYEGNKWKSLYVRPSGRIPTYYDYSYNHQFDLGLHLNGTGLYVPELYFSSFGLVDVQVKAFHLDVTNGKIIHVATHPNTHLYGYFYQNMAKHLLQVPIGAGRYFMYFIPLDDFQIQAKAQADRIIPGKMSFMGPFPLITNFLYDYKPSQ